MDLVDEQHRAFLGVGQIGDQVFGGRQGRAAGDLKGYAQIARDAGGERRLAQSGRAVEQDVPQRLAPLPRGVDGDFQPRVHVALADHVLHPLRAQLAIVFRRRRSGLDQRLAHSSRSRLPDGTFLKTQVPLGKRDLLLRCAGACLLRSSAGSIPVARRLHEERPGRHLWQVFLAVALLTVAALSVVRAATVRERLGPRARISCRMLSPSPPNRRGPA